MLSDELSIFWFLLSGQQSEIERALALTKNHNSSVEKSLAQERDRFGNWLKAEADTIPANKRDELYEWYGEDLMILADDLPNIQRRAMFLSLYTLLEHHMNGYCQLFEERGGIALKLNEIAGRGIERAKKYLNKVVCVDFPSDQNLWNEIRLFNQIRNVIVHRNGDVSEEKDSSLIAYANATKLIRARHGAEIYLEKDFVEHVASVLERFFKDLNKLLTARANQLTANNAFKDDFEDDTRPIVPWREC